MTRTCSRFARSAVKTPRATLVPLPPSRCSVKLQKRVRSLAKLGLKATSRSPPCPCAVIGGKPPCPLVADRPPEPTGNKPPIGCPTCRQPKQCQPPRFFRDQRSHPQRLNRPGCPNLGQNRNSKATLTEPQSEFARQKRFCSARLVVGFRRAHMFSGRARSEFRRRVAMHQAVARKPQGGRSQEG